MGQAKGIGDGIEILCHVTRLAIADVVDVIPLPLLRGSEQDLCQVLGVNTVGITTFAFVENR